MPIFRWLSAQEIEVAGHELWAFRMSYAGELGWELHMPFDAMVDVYTALRGGAAHGIADYGSFAMNVMRMEKGFKGAGELTNEVTLAEADVLRFARTDKDYLGRDKTLTRDLPWVCAYLSIEPDGDHRRPRRRGGSAGRQGRRLHRLGRLRPHGRQILAFAYIKPEAAVPAPRWRLSSTATARRAGSRRPGLRPESLLPRTDAVRNPRNERL
jgi:dimethylglycine dehydrogenase